MKTVNPARMEKLAGFQRKFLRGLAHGLNPVVMIGKSGLTEAVQESIDQALRDHELIKIKFVDFKDERESITEEIASRTASEEVGAIGHVAIFYRRNEDPKKRKIRVPQRGESRNPSSSSE
jgi:RNA-binding protein